MVGPNYAPPQVKVQPAFTEAGAPGAPTTQPSVTTNRPVEITQWWATFQDPELESLVDRAVKGNFNLRQAESRIRQARFQEGVAGATLYPTINTNGGYQRAYGSKNLSIASLFGGGSSSGGTRGAAAQNGSNNIARPEDSINETPTGGPPSPLGSGGLPGTITDLYEAGFDATWEIDVFGGQRRGIEAANDDMQAAVEDRRDALVSLIAEVARNYVQLRGEQRQYDIARQNLAAQQDELKLTESKFRAGFVTQLDVARQATQVATTAATLPALEANIRVSIHALGVLLGQDPDGLEAELVTAAPIPPVPPEVPIGLPSDLLRRRPDIRRAERQIAAATARIGQATADLYPKFSITGTMGFDTSAIKHIADWNSRYYALSPGIDWNIFDARRVRNNIDVQKEQQRQAMSNYQQTVLSALQDVEDSLTRYRTEQLRRRSLADAVDASRQAVSLAKQQYDQGVVDFTTVLDAERNEFGTEDSLAQSDAAISTDLVSVYKALGGGWEITLDKSPLPPAD
jgi:multidrug efflux system outer membrane protein